MLLETVQDTIIKNCPKNIIDNCSNLSETVVNNYNKLNELPYLNSLYEKKTVVTKSIYDGKDYIYSSIGNTFQSYTPVIEKVDESEIPRIPPSESLAEGEKVRPLDNERVELVNFILDIYSLKLSKEHFKYYDEDVIFSSPIMHASGLSNLKAQFYGMQKLLVKSTTKSYKIVENNLDIMKISLQQKYNLPFVSHAVVRDILIVLEFNTNRKISKHTDLWNGNPIGEEGALRKGAANIVNLVATTLVKEPKEQTN